MIVSELLAAPIDLLEHPPDAVWRSGKTHLASFGELIRFAPATGPDRFVEAFGQFTDWLDSIEVIDGVGLPPTGPLLFASFAFDERSHGTSLFVPEVVVGRHGGTWFVTHPAEIETRWLYHPAGSAHPVPDRPRYAGSSVPDLVWMESVDRALDQISRSSLEKVVLARDYAVWSKTSFDTRRILDRLYGRFPECAVFLIDGLVGASPEMLAEVNGDKIESVTLAGSGPRSDDPETDELLGRQLLASEKDQREHRLAAASVDASLSSITSRLFKDPEPVLLDLANVRHLATRFRGTLSQPTSVLEVAGRMHPTAAVGGSPRDLALSAIAELEGMDRGRYAAPVGWTAASGDGQVAIALRCAEISGARARLFAGSGIVAGSLPESELEETRLKLGAMLAALDFTE